MTTVARNQHFVPQGYLAAFTNDGTRDGRLFVSDLVSQSTFQTKPRNVAAKRDFNRVDVDGLDPGALEQALGQLEGKAVTVIRGIRADGELPGDQELGYVVNLMALLVARNPKLRRAMNTARRHEVRIIGDLLTSDRRRLEHDVQKAKDADFISGDDDVSGARNLLLVYEEREQAHVLA